MTFLRSDMNEPFGWGKPRKRIEHTAEVGQLAYHASSSMHTYCDDPFAKIKRLRIITITKCQGKEWLE